MTLFKTRDIISFNTFFEILNIKVIQFIMCFIFLIKYYDADSKMALNKAAFKFSGGTPIT